MNINKTGSLFVAMLALSVVCASAYASAATSMPSSGGPASSTIPPCESPNGGLCPVKVCQYMWVNQTPLTTLHLGNSLIYNSVNVTLVDLGVTNYNGVAPAVINVQYKNTMLLQNVTVYPKNYSAVFYVGAGFQKYSVYVNKTVPGLYYYARFAQLRIAAWQLVCTP